MAIVLQQYLVMIIKYYTSKINSSFDSFEIILLNISNFDKVHNFKNIAFKILHLILHLCLAVTKEYSKIHVESFHVITTTTTLSNQNSSTFYSKQTTSILSSMFILSFKKYFHSQKIDTLVIFYEYVLSQ
jgi:hypothetical protein